MKISIEWLKEYVEIAESPSKLKEDLTMSGLAVESISESACGPVLETEITSNRPDCLSHIGVAREVAALYKRSLKIPPTKKKLNIRQDTLPFSIEIRDPDLCPRYVGLVMDGIRMGPSPDWMQGRLEAAGMRPVNNIVDITNYVLLEYGHPLHAFDLKRLRQGKIVVGRAQPGQKITTLDGIERELDGEMLLINDGEGPVAIAGVMGGQNSEIGADTKEVLLECAWFLPSSVRRTSKKLGLSTEASYRFERGADWNGVIPAIARTCYLIQTIAGGHIAGSVQDAYPKPIEPVCIALRGDNVEKLLGAKVEDAFIVETLRQLQFKVVRKARRRWAVTCPSFRADMELEADLIEEVARFFGYQNIPTTLPGGKSAGQVSPVTRFESATRRILLGLGYSEAINLSFAGETEHAKFRPSSGERIAIRNPLTEETQFLRSGLVSGLVKSARRNFNYGNEQVRLFELGHVYLSGQGGVPEERNMLGILATGGWAEFNWRNSDTSYDFFHIKGVVAALLRGMNSAPAEFQPAQEIAWLNPSDATHLLIDGKTIGCLGSLHAALQEEFKFKQPVFLAEIDFAELAHHVFQPVRHQSLPRFPAVERDLSIIVSRDLSYGQLHDGVMGLGIAELKSMLLIDVFEGEKIPQGKISMTLRFTFQDREATLTIDRVQAFSDNILAFLSDKYNAELRYQL